MTAWLPSFDQDTNAKCQLFCLPHAGGASAIYHRWQKPMGDQIDVVPIKLPGRESRFHERPIDNMPEMIDGLMENVAPRIKSPFAIFGHSMGGLVAYEWARRLVRAGHPPQLLIASASRAPHRVTSQGLHTMPDEKMVEKLTTDYGHGKTVSPEERQMMLIMANTIRADLQLLECYDHKDDGPLPCPIVGLHATDDMQVTRADVQAWGTHTTAKFTLRSLSGPHFFLKDQQSNVLSLLRKQIAKFID